MTCLSIQSDAIKLMDGHYSRKVSEKSEEDVDALEKQHGQCQVLDARMHSQKLQSSLSCMQRRLVEI